MRLVVIPLAALGLASTAHAEPRYELSVGSSARALRSPSANALTDHNLGGASFGAAVDLGAQRVRVDLADHAGTSASDHRWGRMAAAGAALDLVTRPGTRFGFGVRVEVGYVMAQAVSLTPHREVSGDVLMLAMTDAALGQLDLGGPTLGASLVGQF
jgi:hypothetical protein